MTDRIVREYGHGLETLIAVHGGPAAAGDLAPLARVLSQHWRVLEPYQRGSGGEPLTVATHVEDLDAVVREQCGGRPVILVGHSWGAMLALAYAAAHPTAPTALVLIGCGTFSQAARTEFEDRRKRASVAHQVALAQIARSDHDPNRRLAVRARVMTRIYGFDVDDDASDLVSIDAVAHSETWADMVRLQNAGVYPAAFAAIDCPVLMLHGDCDPHPGRLIRDDLAPYMLQLEYREFPRCGHSPWIERAAREEFLAFVNQWIAARWTRGGEVRVDSPV
jgi:pimeloyl-ACP methyl ester carboxylesterase